MVSYFDIYKEKKQQHMPMLLYSLSFLYVEATSLGFEVFRVIVCVLVFHILSDLFVFSGHTGVHPLAQKSYLFRYLDFLKVDWNKTTNSKENFDWLAFTPLSNYSI